MVVAGVAVLASVAVALGVTRQGIGISRDSAVYLGTARNLLDGKGATVPFRSYPLAPTSDPLATQSRLENFPPLYPALLAGVSEITDAELTTVARALNVVLLAALVLLLAGVTWAMSRGSLVATTLVAFVALASMDVLITVAMAWTELLFTLLVVGALVLVAAHIEARQPVKLWAGAALLALACLTRYAGVAAVVAAAASLVVFARRPRTEKLRDAAVLVAVGIAPLLAWIVARADSSERVGNRLLAFHPPGGGALERGGKTLVSWVLPGGPSGRLPDGAVGDFARAVAGLPFAVRAALALAAVAALVHLGRRSTRRVPGATSTLAALPRVLLVFVGCYLGFLVASMTFFDASVSRLDYRLLVPAHVAALLVVATLVVRRRIAPRP